MNHRETPVDEVLAAVVDPGKSNLFRMLVHEHKKAVADLEQRILNPENDDQTTHDLKQRRSALLEHAPEETVKAIERKARQRFNDYRK
jgi:hypothetical protein